MRRDSSIATIVVALTILLSQGAGAEARAEYPRRTPIVEAVQKTRAGIVTIHIEKNGQSHNNEVLGTGVVVDERGYIVTNEHLLNDAVRVDIELPDGNKSEAQVVAAEEATDLAILHVAHPSGLQALAPAPGNDLMVGETVLAVGHPFGYANSVSTGIISALGRQITMPSGPTLRDLIQISAGINPGNSGGPLLNINGEWIGINVALREEAQGIAFAINTDSVKEMLVRHLSAQQVAGVFHGLTCTERASEKGPNRQRVVASSVRPASSAARAGLQPGDEIRRLANRPVANRFDVERALWACESGQKVAIVVARCGKERTFELMLQPGTVSKLAIRSGPRAPQAHAHQTRAASNESPAPP